MKRVNMYLIAAIVAASSLLTSCGKDKDEVDDPKIAVELTYYIKVDEKITKNVEVGSKVELPQGLELSFAVTVTMGTNPIKELHVGSEIDGKTFKILDSINLDKGIFNSGAKTLSYNYKTLVGSKAEKITFNLLDTKDNAASADITISPPAPPAPPAGRDHYFNVSPILSLGGQSATLGSCYLYGDGKVLGLDAAKSQSNLVDFVYYYGGTNKATIAAPNGAGALEFGKIKAFPIKNNTLLKILDFVVAKVDCSTNDKIDEWFTNTTDDSKDVLKVIAGLAPTDNEAKKLEPDKVIAFKTVGGAKGVIVVTAVPLDATGIISFKIIEYKQ